MHPAFETGWASPSWHAIVESWRKMEGKKSCRRQLKMNDLMQRFEVLKNSFRNDFHTLTSYAYLCSKMFSNFQNYCVFNIFWDTRSSFRAGKGAQRQPCSTRPAYYEYLSRLSQRDASSQNLYGVNSNIKTISESQKVLKILTETVENLRKDCSGKFWTNWGLADVEKIVEKSNVFM